MTTVVLDTEPLSLLTPARRHDPARRRLMARLEQADAVLVPAVVRVEALVPRDAPHADVNRLVDDAEAHPVLRGTRTAVTAAAVGSRSALGTAVSVVDALLAATAGALAPRAVEVITSDLDDLRRLAEHHDRSFRVVGIN